MSITGAEQLEQALQKEAVSGRDDFAEAIRDAIGTESPLDADLGIISHLFVNTENSRQGYILCSRGLLVVEWTGIAVFSSCIPLFRVVGLNTVDSTDEVGPSLGCAILLDTGMRTVASPNGSVTEPNVMQFVARDDLRHDAEEFVAELRNAILGIWG